MLQDDDHNPFAAPDTSPDQTSEQTSDNSYPHHPLASRWARLGGAIIDMVLLSIAFIPVLMILVMIIIVVDDTVTDSSTSMAVDSIYDIVSSLIVMLLFLALNGYLLAKRGQTIGKLALNIRIVDVHTGTIPTFGRTYGLRYLVAGLPSLIPLFGMVWWVIDAVSIFGPNKRCLHDYLASTKVIRA